MYVQTGLAPPNTGRAKPVCANIRTTPYFISHLCLMRQFQAEAVAEILMMIKKNATTADVQRAQG